MQIYIHYKKSKSDPGMPKMTSESQKNRLRIMVDKYSVRPSPLMLDVDLNTLIEVKKGNILKINFDNNLYFKEDLHRENKESQLL